MILPPVLCHTSGLDQQYTAEQMQACRNAALEEAALAAYDWVQYHCDFKKADGIAGEIRRLKS